MASIHQPEVRQRTVFKHKHEKGKLVLYIGTIHYWKEPAFFGLFSTQKSKLKWSLCSLEQYKKYFPTYYDPDKNIVVD